MAVYKVIQDVESEDKLLGPLTFKSFVYAIIAATLAFVEFKLITIGTPLKWIFILMFAGPMILFGVLASPLGKEQPTEIWLLSRIRFFLKPRKRLWDQSGISQLVTVTVPKKVEAKLTKDLSQSEVHSRLKTLALTLDTRGWAIKNVDVNLDAPGANVTAPAGESDRLVGTAGVPRQMPVVDVHAADDILDEKNNPTAKKFDSMMQEADAERRQGLMDSLREFTAQKTPHHKKARRHHKKSKAEPNPEDFFTEANSSQAAATARRRAERSAALDDRLAKARAKFAAEFTKGHKKNAHHKALNSPAPQPEPAAAKAEPAPKPAAAPAAPQPVAPVTAARQTVNMELAQSGSAFSVATLSQLANRPPVIEQTGPDEITISLH